MFSVTMQALTASHVCEKANTEETNLDIEVMKYLISVRLQEKNFLGI